MISLLIALILQTQCVAEDSGLNLPTDPPKSTVDWVAPGFYVVYSPRVFHPYAPGNVKMTVVPLGLDKVLLFGTGYGDTILGDRPPAEDMALVDHVIRDCLLFSSTTEIIIVAPHFHPDHLAPESVHALRGLGYHISTIIIHEGDVPDYLDRSSQWYDGPYQQWTVQDALAVEVVSGTGCGNKLRVWSSVLGEVSIRNRPEHTAGTMDLTIAGVTVLGSQRNTTCTPSSVQRPAHGNW